MDTIQFSAWEREFPFLRQSDGSDVANCDGIAVKRIDANLLNLTPSQRVVTGSLVGIDEGKSVNIVLMDGEVLSKCVRRTRTATHNEAYQDDESWDGESILQAIDRLDIAATTIKFIVVVEYGYEINNFYSLPNWRATIYKVAKDYSIASELEKARKAAAELVSAQVNF